MINIIYLDASGNPVSHAMFLSDKDAPQQGANQVVFDDVLPASFDEICNSWRFKDGVFQKVAPPLLHQVWDKTSESWVCDVEGAKLSRWANIKQQREAAENGGFVWDGSRFDSTPISQSRIQGAVQLATLAKLTNQPFGIDWTLMDNSTRTLSGDDMIAVGQSLATHIDAQHVKARQLRERIEAATTPEQVDAILWSDTTPIPAPNSAPTA